MRAVVAQLVEQLIRNEQVAGSIPVNGSKLCRRQSRTGNDQCSMTNVFCLIKKACGYRITVLCDLPKVETGVRLSLPAPNKVYYY